MAEITNVSKLIINYLTEEQYQTAKTSGLINENELYIESAQRLLGVAHPANHPPSIITQDANNRFVTDAEKNKWNNKQNILTPGDNIFIDDNTISATDTIYDDTEVRSLIDNVADKQDLISHLATTDTDGLMSSTDKTKLDGIETGAEKNTITSVQGRTGAVTISKSDVGLGNVNNVAITQAQIAKLNELTYTKAMTQAQYDALSTAEKNRTDVWYGIYEE